MDLLGGAFGPDSQVCYAVKSNGTLGLLRLLAELGAGFDVVSGGELMRLQAAGVPTDRVVFAGVGKQEFELEAALDAGILFFNLESEHEIELLEAVGARRGARVPLAVRLNPDIDAGTHSYISTGRHENKFGIDLGAAGAVIERIAAATHLELVGYHVHLGSQVRSPEPYLEAFERVAAFVDAAPARSEGVRYYDLGGGFGIPYADGGDPLDVAGLARELRPRLDRREWTPVREPGRFLIADAGLLVTRVIGTKSGVQKNFLLVDGAMNDLLRPALYGAEHPVAPVRVPVQDGPQERFDVVGPVCESSDFLALGRELPPMAPGDLLAVFSAGAYGASMASNYNSRRRPAEVLVSGDTVQLVRRREEYRELWAQEIDP